MNDSNINNLDSDPQETQEWLDSFKDLINHYGIKRAYFILDKLIWTFFFHRH